MIYPWSRGKTRRNKRQECYGNGMKVTLCIDGETRVWQGEPCALREVLASSGMGVEEPCGGRGRCGKCKVTATPPPEATEEELRLLTPAELNGGVRLACITRLEEDCTVFRDSAEASIETRGGETFSIRTEYTLSTVNLSPASLSDPRSPDLRLEELGLSLAPEAVPGLAELPISGGEVRVLSRGGRALSARSGGKYRLLGCAADIGTTTVVVYLMDLQTGERLAVASATNPQVSRGADVVSRMAAASLPGGLEALSGMIRDCLARLMEDCLLQAGAYPWQIAETVVVGNTVMLHLAAGISPSGMAAVPFVPVFLKELEPRPSDWGLPMLPAGRLRLLPGAAAYVGADITASVMASGLDTREELTLLVDIGTNGEMVLGNRHRMVACATAAGPALEGAHIRCGMGGVTGAVSAVGGDLSLEIIGGGTPAGICGSGLVDGVAVLLAAGALDETGRLQPEEGPEEWESRWSREGRHSVFTLAEGVTLCQQDIREVQLAKAAIAAGIRVMLSQWGTKPEEVARVYVAGGFGSRLNRDSACAIGLLPRALRQRIDVIGNGAGTGARMVLLDSREAARARTLVRRLETLELSALAEFQEVFVDEMLFDPTPMD